MALKKKARNGDELGMLASAYAELKHITVAHGLGYRMELRTGPYEGHWELVAGLYLPMMEGRWRRIVQHTCDCPNAKTPTIAGTVYNSVYELNRMLSDWASNETPLTEREIS